MLMWSTRIMGEWRLWLLRLQGTGVVSWRRELAVWRRRYCTCRGVAVRRVCTQSVRGMWGPEWSADRRGRISLLRGRLLRLLLLVLVLLLLRMVMVVVVVELVELGERRRGRGRAGKLLGELRRRWWREGVALGRCRRRVVGVL